MSLSPAATIVLTRAAEHPDRLLEFHRKLPTAARIKMIEALLRNGLIARTKGDYIQGDGAVLTEDAATGLPRTTLAHRRRLPRPQPPTVRRRTGGRDGRLGCADTGFGRRGGA